MTGKTLPLPADLRVNVIILDGHLSVEVRKHDIRIGILTLLDAACVFSREEIQRYAPFAPAVGRQVGDCLRDAPTDGRPM